MAAPACTLSFSFPLNAVNGGKHPEKPRRPLTDRDIHTPSSPEKASARSFLRSSRRMLPRES